MKNKILYIIVFIAANSIAQVNVGNRTFWESVSSSGQLDDKTVDQFKKTTTIFVLPAKEKSKYDEYNKAITSSWFFNPIEVINYSDLKSFDQTNGKYSFIDFSCATKDGFAGPAYFTLDYKFKYLNKKG